MKLAGVAGVLGFALAAIGSVGIGLFDDGTLFDFPSTTSNAAEIAGFVAEHRGPALAGMVFNTLGVALWLVLGAGVWLRLRERGETLLSACFALGLTGFVTLILAGFVPFFVLAYRSGYGSDARPLYAHTLRPPCTCRAPPEI